MRAVILGAALLVAMPVQAQVYKCEVGGRVVFADKPCSDDAQPLVIKPASGAGNVEAPGGGPLAAPDGVPEQPELQRARTESERVNNLVRRRQLLNEMRRVESRIKNLEEEMQQRIAYLQRQRRFANNNLAGATWQRSLADEMNAVSSSYGTQIDGARAELNRLRSERDSIPEN